MIISLSGSNGLVGRSLTRAFIEKGWTVKPLNRGSFMLSDEEFRTTGIEGSDVVINLAGASISKRWTPAYKEEILGSRISTSRKIVNAINLCTSKPSLFISVSAIDIYDTRGTHSDDSNAFGSSFLSEVCKAWEKEVSAVSVSRLVIPRMGMVLSDEGGALEKMYLPFSIGAGAKIGKGDQWISFIHIRDLAQIFIFIIENVTVSGVLNAVSPYPVTNAEFSSTLGKVFKQPVFLTLPSKLLRLMYGEGAEVLLHSHKVLPDKLVKAGFRFKFPSIQNSLMDLFH